MRIMLLNKVFLGALLFMAAGCASVQQPKITELTWPEAPQTPRIKFVGLLRNQTDLGRTSRELFEEALLGPQKLPDALRQPMSVAPSRDGRRLYVTDYAKPGIFVFDFNTRKVSLFEGEAHGVQAPFGIAVDAQDNVYVSDSTTKLIRVFDSKGLFLRNITHESLERPTGIAIDAQRNKLYVADSSSVKSNNHVIRVFDLAGNYLSVIGAQGTDPGKFFFPTYLTIDAEGNLYVADTMNARVQVIDSDGHYVKTIGERGDAYGMFDKPKGVALDSFNNVYVVDSSWSNVQIFNQKGQVLLFFGGRGRFPGFLFNPTGMAIDKNNRIYVADAFNGRICIYDLINTKAGDSFASLPASSNAPLANSSTTAAPSSASEPAPVADSASAQAQTGQAESEPDVTKVQQ